MGEGLSANVDDMALGWKTRNLAEFFVAAGEVTGARVERHDDVLLVDAASPSYFQNAAVLLAPVHEPDLDRLSGRLADFFDATAGGPATVWSPWPTPPLPECKLAGHPPVMLRPAGGAAPAAPSELRVVECATDEDFADAERVMAYGYPEPALQGHAPGFHYTTAILDTRMRVWIAFVDDEPVATGAAVVTDTDVGVYCIATMPEHRGKGYGAAVTWAATLADPTKPALLEASDLGRPIYERMGYIPICRMTLWIRPRRTP